MAKIMVIHHAATMGGGSISFLDILDMLKNGNEIIPCCPKGTKAFNSYMKSRGYEAVEIDFPMPIFNHYNGAPSKLTRTFWGGVSNRKYRDKIKEMILKYKPDIVMVNSSVLCFLGAVIQECGVKSVCFVRETLPEGYSLGTKIMRSELNENFDGVVFLSNYDKNMMKLTKPKCTVVADCMNINLYEKIDRSIAEENLNIDAGKFNVLYVGGLSWLKGIDVLLKSLEYINDDIRVIIAGDFPLEGEALGVKDYIKGFLDLKNLILPKRVSKLLSNNKIREKVEFIGVQKNMSECYSIADVTVFPANLPHQSRPVYESGAYNIPIIISDFKQTEEYVINGKNGLTFEAKNSKDLARKINKLYLDREMLNTLGENNFKMVKTLHNFELEKIKLQELISSIDGSV